MPSKKRWLLIANLALVVVLIATACGQPPIPPAPPAEPPAPGETPAPPPEEPTPAPPELPEIKNTDSFIMSTIGEPDSLDPSYEYDTASYEIIFNVNEGLIFYEREKVDQFVPVLAEDMPEVSDDGLTYTFKVREGIKFHEGGDLTPGDFAYSFWRTMIQDRAGGPAWVVLEPLTGYYAINDIADEMGDEAACEFVKSSVTFDNDAMTVTFHLPVPFGAFMNILASGWGVAMDKEWVAEIGGWDGDCATWRDYNDPEDVESELYNAMNGTGPYKFDHWTPGEEIVVVRNDDYWLTEPLWEGMPTGPAAMERGVWKYVDEWGTRYAMFEAGDVDMTYVPRQYATQADELVREQWDAIDMSDPSKMTILNENGIARSFINLPGVNAADVFFNQNVNVEGGNPYLGSGELNGNGIPPDFFADEHVRKAFNYCFDFDTFIEEAWLGEAIQRRGPIISGILGFNPDQEVFTYDLAKCEEEFRLAWDGELWDIGFYLVSTYNSGNDQRRTAAEIIEANVESINDNFSISVLDVPWPTYLDEMVSMRLPLFIIGWIEDYHHPHNWVIPYMHSAGTWSQFQGLPQEQYDRYDAKIAECLGLPFGPEAEACYFEVQAMAVDDVIDIFMAQATGRNYQQLWVQGYYVNPIYPSPMWLYRYSKGYE
jgi:peptide/nickel transport system substrate-binding protein